MTKTEQLNQLFDEWEETVPGYKNKFIRDGVINEELYASAIPKILYVAKEPNNPDQKAGDFREWWKEEIAYTFSYRLTEWSFGLLNDFPQYDNIWTDKELTKRAIHSIALMNIKKSGGGGSAEYVSMMEHVKTNFIFLHRQIKIVSPDIIILGTSWSELRNGLFPNIKWTSSGYVRSIGRHENARVIDYYHPSSRTPPAASYSLLQNIVQSDNFKNLWQYNSDR